MIGCGSGGGAKQEAFGCDSLGLRDKAGIESLAVFVQQERIFESPARKETFSETRQEDDVEGAAARLFDGADEDQAVAAHGRLRAKRTQLFRENVVDFVERSGANVAHGFELAQKAQDGLGTTERDLSEAGQMARAIPPSFRRRKGRQQINQGECKMFQTF